MTDTERDQLEESAKGFAQQLGLEYFDTRPHLDIKPLIGKLTMEGMRAYGIVPISLTKTHLTLGTSEQTDRNLLEPLRARLGASGYVVDFKFISQFGWQRLLNRYSVAVTEDLLESGNFEKLNEQLNNMEPKYMFEPLVQMAYQLGASDIHIEPAERQARIRLRIDGTLHPIVTISKERYDLFSSDIQIRANVKWGADEPQGGRISVDIINDEGDSMALNMRLETVPSLHGQDVVIRLFNLSVKFLNLDNLQLSPKQRDTLVRATSHPRGMVLTVGPTGSGKTSTLYSIMNHLNNDEVKIVTLEDPIEYELEGISQIPVRSDNQQLFMEKLRAVLREDPNIVMIGEIRDADTAKTALQASLTGHLVLSTFHASSSAAAVTRLMDMIGQNPLLASSIRLIEAQRLVRTLCGVCKTSYKPSKQELLEIKTAFHGRPAEDQPDYDSLKLYKAVGCDACHHFGYRGRLSLIEQLDMTPKLQELISAGTVATTTQVIEQAAVREGMMTLLQDGVRKAIEGKTTLEEIYGAVGE
ncbi:MAG TPA: GspE/PulE family protein [Candidatus Saccharimonadia bacterium]|nr:GspE/PulE family protein [Candidatus Saccharimonadia bacterium]